MDEGTVCTLPSTQCKRGQYLQFSTGNSLFYCGPCPSGYYCPTGTELVISDTDGQTAFDGKIACPTGLSTDNDGGAVACTSDETTKCPYGSGTSDDDYGCYLCAAGTYQNGSGLTCNTCPMDGSVSEEGASACGGACSYGALDGALGSGKCRYVVLLLWYTYIYIVLYFICYIIGTIIS